MSGKLKLPVLKVDTRPAPVYPLHNDCGGRLIYTGGGWLVCAKCRQSLYVGRTYKKEL